MNTSITNIETDGHCKIRKSGLVTKKFISDGASVLELYQFFRWKMRGFPLRYQLPCSATIPCYARLR